MKKLKQNTLFLFLTIVSTSLFISCDSDDDNNTIPPINTGVSVTVANTFQSATITSGVETAIEDLFMQPAGSLEATANVSDATEFPAYLLGLYDIDIDQNSISFELVAGANDPNYGPLFRTLEPDTFDRYYLTFDEAQNVKGFSSSNSSVNLRIDANNILVVEIGEGFEFQPGASFTITLN
ncbi:hypothetical protein [uncultured Aquimarina sp.]|uniref:hypothetical protein n=1 Tax=uncultured Aquimarina sp. TaxID=575652 RepID=UPI00261F0419|nr:hypothetical protein [uncultured Aquimarina sp.]